MEDAASFTRGDEVICRAEDDPRGPDGCSWVHATVAMVSQRSVKRVRTTFYRVSVHGQPKRKGHEFFSADDVFPYGGEQLDKLQVYSELLENDARAQKEKEKEQKERAKERKQKSQISTKRRQPLLDLCKVR
jgi:hypothetical protein